LVLELVDKEIKRPSFLIIMWSPFFILGFRTGLQRNQMAFLFDYLVKCFLHTWFRTGRQRNQEASSLFSRKVLTSHLIKKWSTKKLNGLSLWLSCEVFSSHLV
jgi:hypothetical protein